MKQFCLVVPDLFPAAENCAALADLRLPTLEMLLARGVAAPISSQTLETWLCAAYKVAAIAPVRARADGLAGESGHWLCADPVNLQLHRTQMILQPAMLASRELTAQLIQELNVHFAERGLTFYAPQAQRWYIRSSKPVQLHTHPLSQVLWRDVKAFQPQGEGSLEWQAILTEIQMVLHSFSDESDSPELAVNSLWLWGNGEAQMPLTAPYDRTAGDSTLAQAFAQVSGTAGEQVDGMLSGAVERILFVWEAVSLAAKQGDLAVWRDALIQLEQRCLQPLWAALRAGNVDRVSLIVLQGEHSRRYDLGPSSLWKFWRRPRSLATYTV